MDEHLVGIDPVRFSERAQISLLDHVLLGFRDIDPVRVVKRDGRIADANNFHPRLVSERQRGDGTDVAKSLDNRGAFLGIDFQHVHRPLDQINNAAAGGFTPAFRAADRDRFAGDDFVHAIPLIDRIGVHEPRHDLLVRPHVGAHDVGMRTDERNHFLHVTPRDGFELVPRKLGGIARNAAFGAAVGQIGERAFPAHPHGERRGFSHGKTGRETGAALGRAKRQVVLNAIALESLNAAVVHVNRERDRDGALRIHQPIAVVAIDFQVIGDDLELVASHLEHVVVVNAHKERPGR